MNEPPIYGESARGILTEDFLFGPDLMFTGGVLLWYVRVLSADMQTRVLCHAIPILGPPIRKECGWATADDAI
jgi:hypothetical protein